MRTSILPKRLPRRVLTPVFALCPFTLTAGGQQNATPDARFVVATVQAAHAEVLMSNWARKHALSDEVQALAGEILRDHTALTDELRLLAADYRHVAVPDADVKDAIEIESMKACEPNLLDTAYLRQAVKWYEREAVAIRWEIQKGKDPKLMVWAFQQLPVIKESIRRVRETEHAIGVQALGRQR